MNEPSCSPKAPLDRAAVFPSDTIKRYVNNLFPEGRAFEIAVEQLRISKTNSFALLAEFGRDMAGAVEFVDPAATAPKGQPLVRSATPSWPAGSRHKTQTDWPPGMTNFYGHQMRKDSVMSALS